MMRICLPRKAKKYPEGKTLRSEIWTGAVDPPGLTGYSIISRFLHIMSDIPRRTFGDMYSKG
jgi:hypothetical protein